MIRLAIVGIGGYGGDLTNRLRQAQDSCGARLVAAADMRLGSMPQRETPLSDAGVALYDHAVTMFEDLRGRCEAVFIASGIASHAPLLIAAARCGYHIHLEKPPAATVQEVDDMLAALREHNRFCQVGFQALHGNMRLILNRLAEGALGRVVRIICTAGWPRPRSYYRRNEWAGRLRSGQAWVLDGPVTNALAHQLAHMLAMASGAPARLAEPAEVRAELYAAGPVESHNTACLEVRTVEGPVVRFYCSHATAGSFDPVIEVVAERGRAVYAGRAGSTITYNDGRQEHRPWTDQEHAEMIANFLDAVRRGDGGGLRCPLSETRRFVVALNCAHESSGRIHRIPQGHWHLEQPDTDAQRVVVEGLDDLVRRAGREGRLFSDLPDAPPWAVATVPFSAAGYSSFPRQFRCDVQPG